HTGNLCARCRRSSFQTVHHSHKDFGTKGMRVHTCQCAKGSRPLNIDHDCLCMLCRQIKRRENHCSTVSRVWLDVAPLPTNKASPSSAAEALSQHQTLSLSPDSRNNDGGFMIYVETKGGLTAGRVKQRYLLLKRNAFYVLSAPVTTGGMEIVTVTLKSRG